MKQNQRLYVVMNKESDFQKGHGFQVEISREGVQLREDALFGIYTTCVWDSREKEMTWHRLRADVAKGSSVSFTVQVYASESPWITVEGNTKKIEDFLAEERPPEEKERFMAPFLAAVAEHPEEALLLGVKGRYLWLSFRFLRREEETPMLRGLMVEFPRRSWVSYLPEIYQREQGANAFTERFLAVFQKMSEELTDRIEAVPSWMEPSSTGFSFLQWLAELFSVEEAGIWKEEQLRYLISHAARLYQIRGTAEYLKEIIRLHTGFPPFLVEYHRVTPFRKKLSDGRRVSELYCSQPYEFALLLPQKETADGNDNKILRRMVDLAKPAGMECRILTLKPYIFLDQYSYLGINSVLGRYQPARLDGLCAVPFSTVPESERKGRNIH
ncbi:phage tail protein [Cuneatibacter sp. NSJ-177]|uniref:phage tail protein n=1 Tax=Cuneatibacter sp. NSJ-177 TaxID=2931401 RepID=UPI001FD3C2C5|nr:phage tail protein [Cuneatibacter sp. NSJ-177]